MRWRGRRQSTNIRDVRDSGGGLGGGFGGGLGGGMRRGPITVRRAGGGGIGIGAVVVILVVAYFLGVNPLELLSGEMTGGPAPQSQTTSRSGVSDEMRDFVATVLADTEDAWTAILRDQQGRDYPLPTLTLFSGAVRSACGSASSATGPFYCPGDQNVYIDLDFYDELRTRFGAPGDFAEAYVLAHEVGHHVQNVLGILPEVNARRARVDETTANALSVRTELQADCFAGIWANHTEREGILDPGDIKEALTAAAAVGDDALQRQAQGYVVPDSFTHGTSKQRAEWFRRGYEEGRLAACDTFSGDI
jgi:uncharacterized protein